jgi:hypothetical protein
MSIFFYGMTSQLFAKRLGGRMTLIYDSIVSASTEKNPDRFHYRVIQSDSKQAYPYFAMDALSIPVPRLAYGGMVIGK